MKVTRKIVNDQDYDAQLDTYVDEDDYAIDCEGLDDTELFAEDRNLRQLELH